MPPLKRAVSFAVHSPNDDTKVFVVLRPEDDEELPNVWGLPAASLREAETWTDAVKRAGREKLGVDLEVGCELNRGETKRENYTLQMRLFEARIVAGSPSVPQHDMDVTQYREWKWDLAEVLRDAAEKGSLCCRLYLEHFNSSSSIS